VPEVDRRIAPRAEPPAEPMVRRAWPPEAPEVVRPAWLPGVPEAGLRAERRAARPARAVVRPAWLPGVRGESEVGPRAERRAEAQEQPAALRPSWGPPSEAAVAGWEPGGLRRASGWRGSSGGGRCATRGMRRTPRRTVGPPRSRDRICRR